VETPPLSSPEMGGKFPPSPHRRGRGEVTAFHPLLAGEGWGEVSTQNAVTTIFSSQQPPPCHPECFFEAIAPEGSPHFEATRFFTGQKRGGQSE